MASSTTVASNADAARDSRYLAQRIQWAESSLPRVRDCGRVAVEDAGVGIRITTAADGSRHAGFSGLATCGSTWACAVCSAKIAQERSAEVAEAIVKWEGSGAGRRVCMVTLTMRHKRSDSLEAVWDALTYAWSKATSGRGWMDEQLVNGTALEPGRDRIPWVRFVEVTQGRNGWHVHVHALLFLRDEAAAASMIGARMFARWSAALQRKGLEAPTEKHGFDVRVFTPGAAELGEYLTKATYDHAVRAGWEAAGGSGKKAAYGNRTPFAILHDVVTNGDAADLALWHEWERGSKGRRQVAWSRGFRAWLELLPERTDDEIAAAELDGETVAWADPSQWCVVRRDKAALLRAAEALPLVFLRSAPVTMWVREHEHRRRLSGVNAG